MRLDLSSYEKAQASLKKAFKRSEANDDDTELRDASIQRFEYTFEIAWKMLKRQLELDIANKSEVDAFSKKTLFRVGAERALLKDVEAWFDFLEKRNLTTHTYDEACAADVYASIANFIGAADYLLEQLKKRNA